MRVLNTPVFYIPYIVTPSPLRKNRKSGFLIPSLELNFFDTKTSQSTSFPYYFNISQVDFELILNNVLKLHGFLKFGGVGFSPFWGLRGLPVPSCGPQRLLGDFWTFYSNASIIPPGLHTMPGYLICQVRVEACLVCFFFRHPVPMCGCMGDVGMIDCGDILDKPLLKNIVAAHVSWS